MGGCWGWPLGMRIMIGLSRERTLWFRGGSWPTYLVLDDDCALDYLGL